MASSSCYADLIARFPTSEALFAFLRSDEGGRLIVRDDHLTADLPLTIIFYDKKRSDMTNPLTGAFRSVIWNALTNRPVAAGPHRGLALPAALSEAEGPFTVEEFIDGTMINQWWNGEAWQISTRTQLDAGGSFYGSRSFATLFAETFAAAGLRADDHLDKSVVYSWVLQHPEERIVVAPAYGVPKIWLVERSLFDVATGQRTIVRDALPADSPLSAHLPQTFDLRTVADIQARVSANGRRMGAGWQGVVVKMTATGQRYKLRSVQYNAARMLRGNQAKRPYLWLERWTEGKLPAYLKLYPEEEHDAMATVNAFKTATQEFHDLYLKVYKSHTLKLGDAPVKYRKLIWEARQANVGTYFPNLRNFMNGQDTARKLWLVNFERRYTTADATVATDAVTGGGSAVSADATA
jgi:hypothetical protein